MQYPLRACSSAQAAPPNAPHPVVAQIANSLGSPGNRRSVCQSTYCIGKVECAFYIWLQAFAWHEDDYDDNPSGEPNNAKYFW
jgi:hypothetical protein